jgi:cellulose synthase/poly-beta-1,6-N-acetylglucosamine synthase-like glycosyltransferase
VQLDWSTFRGDGPGSALFSNDNSENDNRGNEYRERPDDPDRPVELDCLRTVLAASVLKAAEARSREVGSGADQVLIRRGVIDETAYLSRLADHTGIALETLCDDARRSFPLLDHQISQAAVHGLLPLRQNGRLIWAVAPRGTTARMLTRLMRQFPALADRLRLVTTRDFNQFLLQHGGETLARRATDALQQAFPTLSAAPVAVTAPQWRLWLGRALRAGGLALLLTLATPFGPEICSGLLAVWFLAFIGLRIAGCLIPRKAPAICQAVPDDQLPVYTVIAALYREARTVDALLRAIDALDYPREKLDVIIVLELDDLETRAALARLRPLPHVQVLIAPAFGPRTKPKALNFALPFARGSFTTVFDAEDRPEPGQLRAALDAFRQNGVEVACVQASLCIDNISESWLSRMFAAEYAGQFDIFLPGFSRLRLPLPLGGSSNHFRTGVLREVGGWDAYNVTEDADLGIRLARMGFRSVMFDSTTHEEAPIRFCAWLPQRSRWMKGWMQTWGVHMRAPTRFWRDAGGRGFLTLNILIGGNILTALAYPLLIGGVIVDLAVRTGAAPGWLAVGTWAPLHVATLVTGLLSAVGIGLLGLARRGRLRSGWVLALTPLYWGCLSIAAWRALLQLLREPYRWEKTEHGLAERETPRRPPAIDPVLADLLRRATSDPLKDSA